MKIYIVLTIDISVSLKVKTQQEFIYRAGRQQSKLSFTIPKQDQGC